MNGDFKLLYPCSCCLSVGVIYPICSLNNLKTLHVTTSAPFPLPLHVVHRITIEMFLFLHLHGNFLLPANSLNKKLYPSSEEGLFTYSQVDLDTCGNFNLKATVLFPSSKAHGSCFYFPALCKHNKEQQQQQHGDNRKVSFCNYSNCHAMPDEGNFLSLGERGKWKDEARAKTLNPFPGNYPPSKS